MFGVVACMSNLRDSKGKKNTHQTLACRAAPSLFAIEHKCGGGGEW